MKWFDLGDNNNMFIFHKSLMARRNKNNILYVSKEDSNILENEEDIWNEAVSYFESILAPYNGNSQHNVQWQPQRIMTENQWMELVIEITKEEIKEVIWSGQEGRALSPNGFTLSSFNDYRPISF